MYRASLTVYVDICDGYKIVKDVESGICWDIINGAVLFHTDTRCIFEFDWIVSNRRMVGLCFGAGVGFFLFSVRVCVLKIPFFPQKLMNVCRAYEL